ncbi:MAG: UbiD family decarboxylase [Firmicutes bacterium]|nr:UbiD family decarboxylase [Bacillota bacterium]
MSKDTAIVDLRSFLRDIETKAPEEMVKIERLVNPLDYEVNTFLEIFRRMGKYPLVKFDRVSTFNGGVFSGSMVTSADPGSYRRAAIAFGLPLDKAHTQDVIEELSHRASHPLEPTVISRAEAPVKATVFRGEEADLGNLPLLMHFEEDAKPGWLTPVVALKHPDTGRYNLAYHRTMYHGPRKVTMKISPDHHTHAADYYNRARELGKTLPFACILGHHPGFYQGAAIRTPYAIDEYWQAAGMMGGLRLVASETWGDAFLVPADSEIVIEGEIIPGEFENEGPFGEWPAYYGAQLRQPVGYIKAITMRKEPIFQAIWTSYHMLEDIAHSIGLQAWIKAKFPRLKAACSLYHTWAIISIDKKAEGEPIRVAALALAYGEHVKHCIIVDKDVNPYDLQEVFWAIAMRVQPDERVQVLRNIKLGRNDPSLVHQMAGSAMIIDATEPVDRPFQKRVAVPARTLERLSRDLHQYVNAKTLAAVPVRDRWTY